jgi:hypothetical protein
MTPVPRPQHQRPGARRAVWARELHLTASRNVRIDRKRARPYDGHQAIHRLGSLPAIGAKRGEEGSLTFNRDGKILTRSETARQEHRQTARPATPQGCSRSQAVNSFEVSHRGTAGRNDAPARRLGHDVLPVLPVQKSAVLSGDDYDPLTVSLLEQTRRPAVPPARPRGRPEPGPVAGRSGQHGDPSGTFPQPVVAGNCGQLTERTASAD